MTQTGTILPLVEHMVYGDMNNDEVDKQVNIEWKIVKVL